MSDMFTAFKYTWGAMFAIASVIPVLVLFFMSIGISADILGSITHHLDNIWTYIKKKVFKKS